MPLQPDRPSRRAYLLAVGAAATFGGCSERGVDLRSGGDGAGSEGRDGPPSAPDLEEPLAERFDVERRETRYRETGDGPLSLEATLPAVGGPYPLVIHVHGGAWRYGGPGYDDMDVLARAGVGVASLEYRLSGTATYPAAVRDVVAGVQWVRANGPDWGVDSDRIALFGGSAGAHLAALVAASPGHPNFQPEGFDADAAAAVDALIGLYGIYDLRFDDACDDRNAGAFLGEGCSSEDVKAEASPVTHVDGSHPPTMLSHGTDDELIHPAASREYRDALTSADVPVEYRELDGVGHGFVEDEELRRRSSARMVRFLFEGPWSEQ